MGNNKYRRIIVGRKTRKSRAKERLLYWDVAGETEMSLSNPDVVDGCNESLLWKQNERPEAKALSIVVNKLDDPSFWPAHFTLRQYQVFRACIIEGKTERQAAQSLDISHVSIHHHKKAVVKKLKNLTLKELENV